MRRQEGIGENQPMAIDHYENFPVASVLCPPVLRAPIAAIYHFARTADDIADEGDATPAQRLETLAQYRLDLEACSAKGTTSGLWPKVFPALSTALQGFDLPVQLLRDLISAFEQDVRYTANQHHYASRAELLDYCRLSANPVGRLLLHLYRIDDAISLSRSDQICSALQLINFWQDLSVDIPRGRHYIPTDALQAAGMERRCLPDPQFAPQAATLVAQEARFAAATMAKGQTLAKTLPGRAGWELRLVVQGGLRILDKMEQRQFDTLHWRPTISAWDVPVMLWRALRM